MIGRCTGLSELELPAFDHTDPDACAASASTRDGGAARAGLARAGAVRLHGARSRVGRVLPAHALGDLPGDEDRRDLRRDRGAAVRADAAQHPARQRRRPLAPAQPREPGAVAARGRALPAGDAGVPRAAAGEAIGRVARGAGRRRRTGGAAAVRCEFVEAFAKPYPSHGDRDGDGRAAGGRAAAAPLVELDPAAVRRGEHGERARGRSSRRWRSSTSTRKRSCARAATTRATT